MKTIMIALTCFLLGGVAFYSYNQYQKVMEENKNLKAKVQNESTTPTVPTESQTPFMTVSPKPSEEEKQEGSIQGVLGYPASGIPELIVYAFDSTDQKKYFKTETAANQSDFTISGIAPGTYYVVAYAKDYAISGAYTKMVACGLSVDCKDHGMIAVSVKAGEVTKGAEVKDWYAPEGTFPKKP